LSKTNVRAVECVACGTVRRQGIEFSLFEKSSVARLETHARCAELAAKTGRASRSNSHKYAFGRTGACVANFGSRVTPDARELVSPIEKPLAEKGVGQALTPTGHALRL